MEVLEKPLVKTIKIQEQLVHYPVGNNMDTANLQAHYYARAFFNIKQYHKRTIELWCRGSSGAILASLMYSKLCEFDCYEKVVIKYVKKEGEQSHSSIQYSYPNNVRVIVDDFIATGKTIVEIMKNIVSYDFDTVLNPNVLIVCSASCLHANYYNKFDYIISDTFKS